MKHFEIDYYIGHHTFTFKCTTAHEAFDALMDMGRNEEVTLILSDADEYMEILLNMKKGKVLKHETHRFAIRYVDGEV